MTSGLDPGTPGRIQAVLLDIEGTTTSIQFVYQTLFPYARRHIGEFLERQSASRIVQDAVRQLHQEWAADAHEQGHPPWSAETQQDEAESAAAYCRWLIGRDRKSTPLKTLQGMIWESGYQSGELRGHVYPDVPAAFERWKRKRKTISIFSSGSVLAQKLIFAHTDFGDLTPFLAAHFDTTTGAKREVASYRKIAAALSRAPREVLFLSDSVPELDAGRAAGMETALSARAENPEPGPHDHRLIRSFEEVFPDSGS